MTDELSVTAKQQNESFKYPRRINKKVSKMQNDDALAKFKDEQDKNEHCKIPKSKTLTNVKDVVRGTG